MNNLPPLAEPYIEKKTNFLKKRMGSGGSPGKLSASKLSASHASQKGQIQMTTVRVRQRDNSYQYKNAPIADSGSQRHLTSMSSQVQTNMLWEKKRIN